MPEMTYPALYHSADKAAARFHRLFLALIAGEYILLILASAFLLIPEADRLLHVAYAVIFVVAIGFLSYRTIRKPEQAWGLTRAIAEQVKSYAWRYAMRAEPFEDNDKARASFRDYLRTTMTGQHDLGAHVAGGRPGTEAITAEMDEIRAGDLVTRRDYYRDNRLGDQVDWYAHKAAGNRRAGLAWVTACIIVLLIGFVVALLKIVYHHELDRIAIEPLIIIASSILGWMQANKYNQLAASYTIAAYETGLMLGQLEETDTEEAFARLVDDAETTFARENHQWAAKQQGGH
ncbi:MAG: DUF4231 domain-containing protein [Bauldia sp.]|uniref:DUF4231 domain-containing protein n=1 Tax=Bauldia sp. TaxID=2575872 RepID=UPI001D34C35F|nr:DUF4231 domain-containing protein [Bauldia sp.]MCB1494284.1 DUF4231 domain-containing protein [Bauldia sp.]